MSRESDSEPFLVAVTRRVIRILETHALRVRLGVMKESVGEARIVHRGYRHAFPLMVGSFMILAAFLVPMGFQFLAVLGGKALILSQIALVMAMGSSLHRYFGLGVGNYGAGHLGGAAQHDYYLRDGLHPWHREDTEESLRPDEPYQQHLTQQQLQGFLYHQHPGY